MKIVKQTLHPEGDTGTDIYPKTSTDQIVDLPLSSQKQLYAHYIQCYNTGGVNSIQAQFFVINSDNTIYTSLDKLLSGIQKCVLVTGTVSLANEVGTVPAGRYSIVRNEKNDDDLTLVITGTDAASYGEISLKDNFSISMYDALITLGSNAGQ